MSADDVRRLFDAAKPYRPGDSARLIDPARERRETLVSGSAFLSSIPPPQYVLRPVFQRQHVVAVTGITGHGKTTLTNYFVVCALKGDKTGPVRARPCRVLMLIGENPPNAALQLLGAVKRAGLPESALKDRLIVRPISEPLVAVIDDLKQAELGEIDLVIVDTSAAFFSYADDNDNVQMRQHAMDLRRLTELPGRPAVAVNCHPVKNASRDNMVPRGGSSFLNELDANLTVWNDGEFITLHHTKMRGPSFDPMMFRLEPQDVGITDDEGVPIKPPVAVPLSDAEHAGLSKRRHEDENRLLYAMLRDRSASIASMARDCGWNPETSKSKVQRLLKNLEDDKLVRKYRGRYGLTESGKREAERVN